MNIFLSLTWEVFKIRPMVIFLFSSCLWLLWAERNISENYVVVWLRQEIVCGVQSVTRGLERDKLRLVIVDRSSPWQLHQHLAQLSAVRQCPAVAVDNLANTLSAVLAVTRLCALGFKVPVHLVLLFFAGGWFVTEGHASTSILLTRRNFDVCADADAPW